MANNGESSDTNYGCRLVFTMYGDQYEILIRRLPTPTSAPEDGNLYEVPVMDLNENHPNVASTSANAHNPEGAGPSRNANMIDMPSSSTRPPSRASTILNAHNHEWAGPSRNSNMMDMPTSSTRPPGRARTRGIVINTEEAGPSRNVNMMDMPSSNITPPSLAGIVLNPEGAGPSRNVNMMDMPSSSTTPPNLETVPYVGRQTNRGNRKGDFTNQMYNFLTAYIPRRGPENQNGGNMQIVPAQVPNAENLAVVLHEEPPLPIPLFPDILSEGVIDTTNENLSYEERRRGWIITYRRVNRTSGNTEDPVFYMHVRSGNEFRTWPAVIAYINHNELPGHYAPGMAPPRRRQAQNKIVLYFVGYFHREQRRHVRRMRRMRIVSNSRDMREFQTGQVPEESGYTEHLFDFEPQDPPTAP